jgi:hypothetical protein
VLTLAAELTPKGLWYPTILGVLVVLAGIVLFCGSIYLLLGTNLGARLGFLVAFTALAGFMTILTLLWCTTASPLNTMKGRIPHWSAVQVVSDPSRSNIAAVRNIAAKKNSVSTTEASNVKAAVDEALVTKVSLPTITYTPNDNRFAQFPDVTKYLVLETYEVGGSHPRFWKGEFTHSTQYAAVHFCQVVNTTNAQPFGLPPLPPECDTAQGAKTGWVILQRDLGSLRTPPFVAFCAALILFLLGLLALHWREKDQMELERAKAEAEAGPVAVAVTSDDSELAKV